MDNELLQAIGQMMDSKLGPIRTDIQTLKEGQASTNARLQKLEDGQQAIREDIATINRDIVPKINHMYDALNGVQEKFDRLDRVETKQDDHDHRIWALEESVKKLKQA